MTVYEGVQDQRRADICRRASAQGTGFTLPESNSSMRRAISRLHSSSADESTVSSRLSKQRTGQGGASLGRQRQRLFEKLGDIGSHGRYFTPPVGIGSQNPRPVSAKNADTRTGHPLELRRGKRWASPPSSPSGYVLWCWFFHGWAWNSFRHYVSGVEGVVGIGSRNPRPVSAKNADTRTGHPPELR
jgi:hypothetical protein